MASRKRSGRAAAEAAYAELMKEATTLVGDVGAHYELYAAKLADAAAERERYEDARAAAIKAGAITSDQLDQMGYKKTQKLPGLPAAGQAEAPAPKINKSPDASGSQPRREHTAAQSEPMLASVGGHNERHN